MMRPLALVLSVALLSACQSVAAAPEAPSNATEAKQPNIIVILADDMGWGDIGLNGASLMKTPNIDRIGREGVQLTHFYAGANVCTPSRAALLTGRYPIRSGMQHVIFPHTETGMPPEEITIAEVLKDAGYATGMIGKWHLGHHDEYWPTNQGFDYFYGVPYSNDMQPFDLYFHKTVVESPADQKALSDNYTDAATGFIRDHADEPFFLYFAQTFPHLPLHVPDDEAGVSEAGLYGDVVEHIDDGVGAILETLEELDLAENTLIIVTSDNGPWFEGDQGNHRDRKGGTHEGSFLVPFLARWPGVIEPGTESGAMAMNIDLLPTLASIAGTDAPGDRVIDGLNILPLMEGAETSPHDVLFFFNGNDIAAVRDARYRLVLNTYYREFYVPFEQYGAALLFDLEKDPEERFSYVRENPDVIEALMAKVTVMRDEVSDLKKPPIPPQPPGDEPVEKGPVLSPEKD
ncbi:sulfatase [Henriciella sp. AS95]|uniref:sulfatase family protein n=1 Tax=Henriciella sp. AS95 TaxID=3135782 RepID=UPI00316C430C